jgi:predicted ATPase/class 3 adenylate cyclase
MTRTSDVYLFTSSFDSIHTMSSLPTGTVTFLFTDIEGSTRLWQDEPQAMISANARHDAILREAIESNSGYIFQIVGDSFSGAFHNASDGLQAAVWAQHVLQTEEWGKTGALKVRMGIHTGAAEIASNGKYEGYATIASAQRVMSVAHGGQVLLTQTTYDLVQDHLPSDVNLRDMGEHHLKDLHAPMHLYQVNIPNLQQNFPPLTSADTLPNNLPTQLTSFIGREKEMAEIQSLLRSTRLVTLTGSGGTGKSRLSVELGRGELPSFTNGIWLIELAPLADPSQIVPTVAQVFGLQEHPFGPLAALLMDYLRDKKILLILDNCEHLIEACARLADDLLHQCAGLKILASSREALGIAGEVAYHIPSLADSESTRLFRERALAANPNFHVTESNAPFVAQICSRLDGIPLAIELAAARVKLLSPEQIAARLNDRFRLLVGGSRTALPRQQTLRALIDWSYDLLSEAEKRLFRTASVFVGGWTLEALEAVAEDPNALEHLEQLVNKSLVVAEARENEMRYFMLETIRQYAREKLFDAQEASAARDRHFTYFDNLVEHIWDVFTTENIFTWRDWADDEIENLRTAVEWALDNHVEKSIRLAGNFCLVTGWIGNRMDDGLTLCRTAIDRVRSLPPVSGTANLERQKFLAKALFAEGMVGMSHGNMPIVIQDLQDAIATARLSGDKRILGYGLEMYFTATTFISAPFAEEAAEEGFRIFTEEVNDRWGLSMAYQNKSRLAEIRGDRLEKEMYRAKYRDLVRQAPLSFQAGLFYLGSGMAENIQGNYEIAKALFEEGMNIFKHIRNWNFQLIMSSELGHIARHTGKISQAKKIYLETLKGWQNMGNRSAIANQLECFALIAITEEEPQRAATLFGAAEALRERVQAPMTDYEQVEYDRSIIQLRSILPEAEFNTLWSEGRAMTMEQAIEMALS